MSGLSVNSQDLEAVLVATKLLARGCLEVG